MYYLSFDCATKSFAYSLSYVNLNICYILPYLNILNINNLNEIKSKIIKLIDGEMVDFFPKIPDNKIDTVERIQKISNYVKDIILPKIKDIKDIEIFIEFQMGSNHKARMISSALIALFSSYKVRLISPSLKNKVFVSEEGKHKYFIKKYKSLYTANKEHAKYNFSLIEKIFLSNIKSTNKEDRGHIADSFMQVLGFLLYSNNKK